MSEANILLWHYVGHNLKEWPYNDIHDLSGLGKTNSKIMVGIYWILKAVLHVDSDFILSIFLMWLYEYIYRVRMSDSDDDLFHQLAEAMDCQSDDVDDSDEETYRLFNAADSDQEQINGKLSHYVRTISITGDSIIKLSIKKIMAHRQYQNYKLLA